MLATAFIVATWLAEREFRRKGLGKNVGWDTAVLALVAGLIGARVNYILENPQTSRQLLKTLVGGAGLTWYGGFVLGLLVVLVFWRARKVRILPGLDAVAPTLALGYAIARIGCQLSGDGDYGKPSNLPWAMAYPLGLVPTTVRVHPAPIYEMLLMLGVFALLWNLRRRKLTPGSIFWVYLIGHGLERFLIEFLRRNPTVFLGLTEAQLVSSIMIVVGLVLLILRRRAATPRAVAQP
jgi:phosphatidylglycerol:prolipoprotein diacylglycerol transferase